MKVALKCGPNDIWYQDLHNGTLKWMGQGIWAMMDVLKLIGLDPYKDLELVTNLSKPNGTHSDLIQTIIDRRADFAPLEFGMTLGRKNVVDFSMPLVDGSTIVISRRMFANASGKFFSSIFDCYTSFGHAASVLLVIMAVYAISRTSPTRARYHSLGSIVTYMTGVFLCQGLPRTFRLCNAARILVSFYSVFAIIVTTIFSGLVIARLLAKERPDQIRKLADLLRMDQYKILIQKGSFSHDLVEKSPLIHDLRPRLIYEEFSVNDPKMLQSIFQRILDEEVVLVDDEDNFWNYLSCLPKSTFYAEDFFLSDPIVRLPGAWTFPNGTSQFKRDIIWKLQLLKDTGIYESYKRSIANKLFLQHGAFYSQAKGPLEACETIPIDRRENWKIQERQFRKSSECENSSKLGVDHLKHVFLVLVGGQLLSVAAFVAEVVVGRIFRKMVYVKRERPSIKLLT